MTQSQDQVALAATLVDAADIEALPWQPLEGYERDVAFKLLWRSGKSVAGIMRIPPGHELGAHTHHRSHHHVWVLDGSAELLGRRIGPGTYAHVPAGVEHGITGVGPDGCTLLYLYLRDEPLGSVAAGSARA